jgi:hypothetical protein
VEREDQPCDEAAAGYSRAAELSKNLIQRMSATIILSKGRPLTTPELFVVGGLFLSSGIACLFGTWFHWNWMQKRLGWLLRWGKGGWSFPASRVGASYGALSLSILGGLMIGGGMKWKLPVDGGYLFVGAVVWMILGVCIALRDYSLHLNNKDE